MSERTTRRSSSSHSVVNHHLTRGRQQQLQQQANQQDSSFSSGEQADQSAGLSSRSAWVMSPTKGISKKRKFSGRVKRACENCKRGKRCCDDGRPCNRCLRLGLEKTCRDAKRKNGDKRQQKEELKDSQDSSDGTSGNEQASQQDSPLSSPIISQTQPRIKTERVAYDGFAKLLASASEIEINNNNIHNNNNNNNNSTNNHISYPSSPSSPSSSSPPHHNNVQTVGLEILSKGVDHSLCPLRSPSSSSSSSTFQQQQHQQQFSSSQQQQQNLLTSPHGHYSNGNVSPPFGIPLQHGTLLPNQVFGLPISPFFLKSSGNPMISASDSPHKENLPLPSLVFSENQKVSPSVSSSQLPQVQSPAQMIHSSQQQRNDRPTLPQLVPNNFESIHILLRTIMASEKI